MILTLHCLLITRNFKIPALIITIRVFVVLHSVALMLLAHQLNVNTNVTASNNNLATHAFMLLKGINRDNGRPLGRNILYRYEQDLLADTDSIFQSHGLAWHHNKALRTPQGMRSFHAGDKLFEQRDAFETNCLDNHAPLEHQVQDYVPFTFTTALEQSPLRTAWIQLHRDSYFALDDTGRIIGYAYIYLDDKNGKLQSSLRGVALSTNLRYIADISSNQPTCLFRLVY